MRRRRFFACAFALGGAAALVQLESGCGSRGPLDDSPFLMAGDGASEAADVAVIEAAPDVVARTDATAGDGGIVACGSCLLGTCGPSIFGCLQDEGCREILQCVTSECTGGSGGGSGGFDTGCLFQCASSDPAAAFQVLELVQCVSGKCGADCTSLLTGLGGGGGGGGPRDAGRRDAGNRAEAGPDGG